MSNDNLLRIESLYIINEYWCAIGCWKSPGIIAFKSLTAIDLWLDAGKIIAENGRWYEKHDD